MVKLYNTLFVLLFDIFTLNIYKEMFPFASYSKYVLRFMISAQTHEIGAFISRIAMWSQFRQQLDAPHPSQREWEFI